VVVGVQPVREVIVRHGSRVSAVLIERKPSSRLRALARFASDHGAVVSSATRAELDRIAGGGLHQGVAAFAPPLHIATEREIDCGSRALMIALDGVTDPHNFGATLRSAVALSATAVIWGAHHAAPLTPATFRASAGAVEHAPLHRVRSLRATLSALGKRGVAVVGLHAQAAESITDVALTGPVVIVVGAEDTGLSRGVRHACDHLARLAISPHLGSFNASVAAALALYEAYRQRAVERPGNQQ